MVRSRILLVVPAVLILSLAGALHGRAAAAGTPPTIVSRSPNDGAVSVSVRAVITATFDQPVRPASLVFDLRNAQGTAVAAAVAYDAPTRTATLTPSGDLAGNNRHRVTLLAAVAEDGTPLAQPIAWSFTTATPRFVDDVVLRGLDSPTAIAFASDSRVFVAEKSGLIKVFSSLDDPTAEIFADLRTNVHNFWDRGLLGLVLHPDFPAVPQVYVFYVHDAPIGGTAPRWGTPGATSDPCPDPPGANANGCVVSSRLSRLEAVGDAWNGVEHVLIEDWFQQYPSHSGGGLTFGADGALYVSAGEGASFTFTDYGQAGDPRNPGGDPPVPIGGIQMPPTAEGGSLRSQDLRTPGDPVTLDGTVIRVDPWTGAGLPGNPLFGSADANARRVIAHGFRNPFRIAFRPGTNDLYVGDVGWINWDEINRVPNTTDGALRNFGWPCYEGGGRQPAFDALNLNLCERLYSQPGAVTLPLFAYNRTDPIVPGELCEPGGLTTSGLAFYTGTQYPARLRGALLFADYSKRCIWAMRPGPNGTPDPARIETFVEAAANPVDLETGPDGDVFYADIIGGTVHRVRYIAGNQPPLAVATATPTAGLTPLEVAFDGTGSTDPEDAGPLAYAWDFQPDGIVDSTLPSPVFTFTQPGRYVTQLRVVDADGLSATTSLVITAGSTAPRAHISTPTAATRWRVGERIAFAGSGDDDEDGALAPSALTWALVLHHCSQVGSCHQHPVQEFAGTATGAFTAPDHEYPSYLELRLTVVDSSGLASTHSVRLDPRTVNISFDSVPAGLTLQVGGEAAQTPFAKTVIVGSRITLTAPSPQGASGRVHYFSEWSDGGARSHDIVAPAAPLSFVARFVAIPLPPAQVRAAVSSNTEIRVTWADRSTDESGFRIERSPNGVTFDTVATVGAGVTSHLDQGLPPQTFFWYRVRAFNGAGVSAPSNVSLAATLPNVIRVNFQPIFTPVPAGFLPDVGAMYGLRPGGGGFFYGWSAPNPNAENRNVLPGQLLDTFNRLPPAGAGTWDIALADGRYSVRIVAGDPLVFTGRYRIAVEGVLTVDGTPSSAQRWIEGTAIVTVNDGKLTISSAPLSFNNKICFVEIRVQP